MAPEGLITVTSQRGFVETLQRLESALSAKGLTLFARIDHAANAREAGLTLRPTFLLIFGNARGGTPLMAARQTSGIDLPLKMLVWEDEGGGVQLSYNDPAWLARRHGLGEALEPAVAGLQQLLPALAQAAGG